MKEWRKLNLTSSQASGWDVSTVPTNLGCQITDFCSTSSGEEAWRLCLPLLCGPESGLLVLSDRASFQIQSCRLKEERRIVSVSLANVYTTSRVMRITSPMLSIRCHKNQINEKEIIACRLIYHYPTLCSVYSIQLKEQFAKKMKLLPLFTHTHSTFSPYKDMQKSLRPTAFPPSTSFISFITKTWY